MRYSRSSSPGQCFCLNGTEPSSPLMPIIFMYCPRVSHSMVKKTPKDLVVSDDSIPVCLHSRLQRRVEIEQTARALREIAISVLDIERVTAVTLFDHRPHFAGEPEDPSGTQQPSPLISAGHSIRPGAHRHA